MLETIDRSILILHIAVGFLSLVLFWIPVFSKKGGDFHVRIGKLYTYTMWVVVLTALLLCLLNLFTKDYLSAGFLGFISILTLAPLWYGMTILKHKQGITRTYFEVRRWLHVAILLSAIGLLIWGSFYRFEGEMIILLIFGLLGLTATRDVFASFDKVRQRPWIKEHLVGMLGTGIAAYTAFLVFGGTQLFGHIFAGKAVAILWVSPTIIGTGLISRMSKRYAVS
ncbi:MAG: hypothetical protein KTR24_01720 [Saprospiraceae bacterium]|nr:hypothetical protein [Saprospiraceae bacterium]